MLCDVKTTDLHVQSLCIRLCRQLSITLSSASVAPKSAPPARQSSPRPARCAAGSPHDLPSPCADQMTSRVWGRESPSSAPRRSLQCQKACHWTMDRMHVGIPVLSAMPFRRPLCAQTYMIDGDKLPPVLKHHDLLLCVPCFRVLPVVNGYLGRPGAVMARHVEHTASRPELLVAQTLLANARRVVQVGIG